MDLQHWLNAIHNVTIQKNPFVIYFSSQGNGVSEHFLV